MDKTRLREWELTTGIEIAVVQHGHRLPSEPLRSMAAVAKSLLSEHVDMELTFAIARALRDFGVSIDDENRAVYVSALKGALEHTIRSRRPAQLKAASFAAA